MKKTFQRWLIVPVMLALAACSGSTGDKYPFSPQFASPADFPPLTTLSTPPAPYSKEYNREISQIIARQKKLTAEDKAAITVEDHITPTMIVEPVMGNAYNPENYPALYTLLKHAASDAWRIGDAQQEHWNRTRPWLADNRVQLLAPSIKRPSYPSGHSTTNFVWAQVLSEIFPPEQGNAFFARARAIANHRVDGGVHFPSDVEAGRKLAAKIFQVMQQNPAFQAELKAAEAEVEAKKVPVAYNDNTPLPKLKVAGAAN